ncbi:MAG TPA: diguanylate cyclase [Halanaerobiales bacterium]|mgnify:FL=1|nr:diguanylate cyclase [Bacillota bacterium]HOA41364.1 diguanylate cyclase [Halanaerobiales bacterium]HPZ63701.1 diguanylate cyclase [Halanaerobiales bacterium]HQD04722.1 diguanylate cyclase [Halanaerobiales bacterium]
MVKSANLYSVGIEGAEILIKNSKKTFIYEELVEALFHGIEKALELEEITFYVIDDEMENLKGEAIYNRTGLVPCYDFITVSRLFPEIKRNELYSYKARKYYYLMIPLFAGSQLLGLIELQTLSPISKKRQMELKAMAGSIAIGLRSLLFERDTIREKENTEFSLKLNNELQSITKREDLIDFFLEKVVENYHFDLMAVFLFNEEKEIAFCRGISENGRVFTMDRFPTLPDLTTDYVHVGDNIGYWIPLKTNTGIVGATLFYNLYTLYKISDSLLNTLRILCSQFANALDNLRMFSDLQRSAFYDSLTGLYNRTYFDIVIDDLKEKGPFPLAIIMGDLNGLKIANDVFGHSAGDKLLKEMAGIIRSSCPAEASIFRWGGDEFFVLLPHLDDEGEIREICQTIKNKCRENRKTAVPLSISLGYAVGINGAGNIARLIKIADERMYRNKLLDRKNYRYLLISSLKGTLARKSYESTDHSERMAELAVEVGKKLGLAGNELEDLKLLALLHDLGKVVVSDEVLNKTGPLTEEEWEEVRKHPEAGYRISQSSSELSHISNYILNHHEHWDGRGYPLGHKGEEIPLLSRIISVVDAYDVMTNGSSYKEAISHEEALEELQRCAGTQFDPYIVKVFCELDFNHIN